MRRKYGRLRKIENVVVFPGTYERIVEEGLTAVDQSNFKEAIDAFDQAIRLEPDDSDFLGPYAVALYEMKDFYRAKEIAGKLLHSGTADYIDAMELYLTISIQLQEYDEVELTIDTLFDEGIIPDELHKKFNYMRELNERLAKRYGLEEHISSQQIFTLEEFKEMSTGGQQMALASLEGTDISGQTSLLKEIAEMDEIAPLCISFALTLLQQEGFNEEVNIRKFGMETICNPSELLLPGEDAFTQSVQHAIDTKISKDPSRQEMASSLIGKFAITAYPFNWGSAYSAEEVADAYIDYIESLFSGAQMVEDDLGKLIRQIDTHPDF